MERRPPENHDTEEMTVLSERQHTSQRHAGRAALRVVDSAEASHWRPSENLADAPDLGVDEETAILIHRRRYRAVVKAKLGSPAVHGGVVALIDGRLRGREPATMLADDIVEVNFGVMDDGPKSWNEARLLGNYLTSIVDPVERRDPHVAVCFVDTSKIDPYLPEDRRTLR